MLKRVLAVVVLTSTIIVSPYTAAQVSKDAVIAKTSSEVPGDASEWKFESLVLKDGTVYTGLIQAERENEIEFAEIFQPPGKPMFAVVRPVDPKSVEQKTLLEGSERTRLLARFQQFRNRARIEAGDMESVALSRETRNGIRYWTSDRDWFHLESTAEENMTRRCVVRVEQVFRAYRQLLPPHFERPTNLRLLLFGKMDEYRHFLGKSGFKIASPAFYSSSQNMIVAGSDLDNYARRLKQVRAHNDEVRRQYKMLAATFTDRLAGVLEEMRKRGYSDDEIEQEAKLRNLKWQQERDEAMNRIDLVNRQNEARFLEVTQQMFTRLYHEAFHAYVENYVYPHQDGAMPRWLDEGLAQIFETGQLDADALRIDAPDPDRLKRLQEALAGASRLGIRDVLAAQENDFLAMHREDTARRHYLYSWGLAYYLAYERNLLMHDTMDQYVANERNFGPTTRFVRLIGMPLQKFEQLWRTAMSELKPM